MLGICAPLCENTGALFIPPILASEVKKLANAKVLEQKKATVSALSEKIGAAASGVLVDYKGITVEEDTKLRAEMRKNGVEYAVIKNTLLRFAMNANGYEEFDPLLNGTTALALSDDSIAAARVVTEFASKFNGQKFTVKGGFVEGRVLDVEQLKSIGALSSKDALIAQVLGTLLAPITSLAFVLKQAAEKGGAVVESKKDEAAEKGGAVVESKKDEAAEEAPAEAPVEETAAPAEEAPAETTAE